MPSQTQKEDGKELFLGALFLVDNAPECPDEMSWHDFVDWVIAEHLKQHSYYYTQKGNRELVTVDKMRSHIHGICNNYAKPNMPKADKRGKEFKDKVDVLFGYGKTELLRKDLLARRGYEKGKIPESRLNKHVSEEDASGVAEVDGGLEGAPESAQTHRSPENMMPEEQNGSHASKTSSSHDVGGEERRGGGAEAAAPASIQPNLPSSSSQVGTLFPPPENTHIAPNTNIVGNHERREQNGRSSDEQPPPSRGEGRRLRSSVDPQTQIRNADDSISSMNEEANAASSGNRPGTNNESVLGAKRKPTQDHGPHKRQCQTKDATHQGNHRPSEASKNVVTSRASQPKPQLARLNLDQQGRNMKELYSDIQAATDAVLSSIGRIRNTNSPLQPKPSDPLKGLYARCWGPRWEEVRARQVDDYVFTTPQVMASLLSAFLYDKVLAEGAGLQEIVSNVLHMGGSLGEALLEEFDLSNRGESVPDLSVSTYDGLTFSRNRNRQEGTRDRSSESLVQVGTEGRGPPAAIKAGS